MSLLSGRVPPSQLSAQLLFTLSCFVCSSPGSHTLSSTPAKSLESFVNTIFCQALYARQSLTRFIVPESFILKQKHFFRLRLRFVGPNKL